MSKLDTLNDNIKAATELLEQAKKEHEEYMVQLCRDGKAEEIIEAEWKERYTANGDLKVYCTHCMAYARTPVKSRRCPYCGAHMRNETDVPKFAAPDEPVPAPDEKPSAKKPVIDLDTLRVRCAIRYIAESRNCLNKMAGEICGLSSALVSHYMNNDKIKPQKKTMDKVKNAYLNVTGTPLPAMRSELENYLEAHP